MLDAGRSLALESNEPGSVSARTVITPRCGVFIARTPCTLIAVDEQRSRKPHAARGVMRGAARPPSPAPLRTPPP